MTLDWQIIITGLIVIAALVYSIGLLRLRHLFLMGPLRERARRKQADLSSICSDGCCGCPHARSQGLERGGCHAPENARSRGGRA